MYIVSATKLISQQTGTYNVNTTVLGDILLSGHTCNVPILQNFPGKACPQILLVWVCYHTLQSLPSEKKKDPA